MEDSEPSAGETADDLVATLGGLMPRHLPEGPFKRISLQDGTEVPFYVVPFTKRGAMKGPRTRDALLRDIAEGDYTDLYVFSHGWNNDWPTAIGRYEAFIANYQEIRRENPLQRPYRPLLLGVSWPSTSLVFGKERVPQAAAGGPATPDDALIADELLEAEIVADLLGDEHADRFFELTDRDAVEGEEALELAEMLAPLYAREGEEDAPSAQDLLGIWKFLEPDGQDEDSEDGAAGFIDDAGGGGGPQAAFLKKLDPRKAVRMFTVWQMKDRAGVVGRNGVGPLLHAILERSGDAAIHMLGHSYGAMVVLSALVSDRIPRPARDSVSSVLLLQPAVNGHAFSADVAGEGFPGMFRPALDIVRLPILSTFSRHDVALTKLFHFALRRKRDLGESGVQAAAGAPSRFAALGGFGPQGLSDDEHREIEMPAPGQSYDLETGSPQILSLRGHALIDGHGDVTTRATAWALLNLVNAAR